MEVIIEGHASFEAERRGISEEFIKSTVRNPQQKLPSKKRRVIYKISIMMS